jgi:hypothetical protein
VRTDKAVVPAAHRSHTDLSLAGVYLYYRERQAQATSDGILRIETQVLVEILSRRRGNGRRATAGCFPCNLARRALNLPCLA